MQKSFEYWKQKPSNYGRDTLLYDHEKETTDDGMAVQVRPRDRERLVFGASRRRGREAGIGDSSGGAVGSDPKAKVLEHMTATNEKVGRMEVKTVASTSATVNSALAFLLRARKDGRTLSRT